MIIASILFAVINFSRNGTGYFVEAGIGIQYINTRPRSAYVVGPSQLRTLEVSREVSRHADIRLYVGTDVCMCAY